MVVSGRVLFGERSARRCCATSRRTSAARAAPPARRPGAVHVVEYFPDPDTSGFHDPRHHAVSLAYVVPVDGDCQPTQEALDLAWFTPEEAVGPIGPRPDDRRPRPPDPPRPRPRRRAPLRPDAPICWVKIALVVTHRTVGGAASVGWGIRHSAGGLAYRWRSCRKATRSTGPRRRCARRSSTRRWCASTRPAWSASRRGPAGRSSRVESHGRHLEVEWDDGIILDTHMRMQRVVAPVPRRRDLADAAPRDAGRSSSATGGSPCASTPRWSRPIARRILCATQGSARPRSRPLPR